MWWQLLRTACSRSIRAPLRFFRQTSLLEGTSAETWNTLESTAKLGSASPAICRIPGGPVTDTEGNDIHILWNEHLMSTCTGTLQFHASLVLHYIYIHINCHDWILSHLWNALLCGGAGWGPMSQSESHLHSDQSMPNILYRQDMNNFCILLHHAGPCERF